MERDELEHTHAVTIQSIEDRVQTEWNWVRATIALHPYLSVLVAFVAGRLIGHIV